MNKKKGIAVAVVLLLILLIGGMIAYFTDTETEHNKFSFGNQIDIEILETAWDKTDTDSNDIPDKAEDIHPGTRLPKNPVIKNKDNSAKAYVFAEVLVPCYDNDYTSGNVVVDTPLFSLENLAGNGWTVLQAPSIDQSTRTQKLIYYYGSNDQMTELAPQGETSPLFTAITLDSSLSAIEAGTSMIDTTTIPEVTVNAYAIQVDGYTATTPSDIYGLYTAQNNTSTN